MKDLLLTVPRSQRSSATGTLVSLTWTLRLLTLLVGILAMHLWISPTIGEPVGHTASTHTAPTHTVASAPTASEATGTLMTAGTTVPEAGSAAGLAAGLAAVMVASSSDGHGSADGSLCELTCPNGHSVMDAMCMIALLIIGLAGFLGLRSALLRGTLIRRGPPSLAFTLPFRAQTVSLVQLSISRT